MRRPFEELTTRQLKNTVVVRASPDVGLVPRISNPKILGGVFPADRLGGVSGRIVRYDQLEVLIVLIEQATQCACKVLLSIENREANADSRAPRVHSPKLSRSARDLECQSATGLYPRTAPRTIDTSVREPAHVWLAASPSSSGSRRTSRTEAAGPAADPRASQQAAPPSERYQAVPDRNGATSFEGTSHTRPESARCPPTTEDSGCATPWRQTELLSSARIDRYSSSCSTLTCGSRSWPPG